MPRKSIIVERVFTTFAQIDVYREKTEHGHKVSVVFHLDESPKFETALRGDANVQEVAEHLLSMARQTGVGTDQGEGREQKRTRRAPRGPADLRPLNRSQKKT